MDTKASELSNPPAFPNEGFDDITDGMTLRDYFAAKALASFVAVGITAGVAAEKIAFDAYKIADAMLAARLKQP